jgi:hypothetical protein
MKASFLIIATFIFSSWLSAQFDLRDNVMPISSKSGSSAISVYNTSPESPNGKYLLYMHYDSISRGRHRGPFVIAKTIVKDRNTEEEWHICNAIVTNHNGSNAFWVNNRVIAVQVDYLQFFELFDIRTGNSLFGKIKGELPHKSFKSKLYFSRCNMRLMFPDRTRQPFTKNEEGIWELNTKNGKIKQLVAKERINRIFHEQNPSITGIDASVLHVEPNPRNNKLLFDYRHSIAKNQKPEELQGVMNANGKGVRWVPTRPMHIVWYDNNTVFGVDTQDDLKRVFRFDLDGKRLELLAGTSTHVGASPNRKWFVGEKGYYAPDIDGKMRVNLYQCGNDIPIALLAEWENVKITWDMAAHVNPAFSNDGERVYFIKAADNEDRFYVVCFDLKNLPHSSY